MINDLWDYICMEWDEGKRDKEDVQRLADKMFPFYLAEYIKREIEVVDALSRGTI